HPQDAVEYPVSITTAICMSGVWGFTCGGKTEEYTSRLPSTLPKILSPHPHLRSDHPKGGSDGYYDESDIQPPLHATPYQK
ncbi:hypothetical protein AVEN_183260-1, partial [Araneus ventricosus]